MPGSSLIQQPSTMHQFRDPRPYTFDDQASAYAAHNSHHASEYSLTTPAYPQYDSSAFYPSANVHESHTSHYYRSMSPSISPRYSSTPRERYYSSDSQGTAPSPTSPTFHSPSSPYFPSNFSSNGEPRSQFIPTPSEMAHTYSNYSTIISRSTTVSPPDRYNSDSVNYPAHLMPSAQGGPHRARGMPASARPRSGTFGTPPGSSSATGERFPCEKCGKTFSRSHDRKRHHETQHLATPIIHRCRWCEKEFSRADSLKRHVDNGCDEAPGP